MRRRAALVLFGIALGCGRSTIQEPHEVNGQVFYTERTVPGIGESLVHGLVFDCAGSTHDDAHALALVPTRTGCTREDLTVSYIPDGIHRVEGCGEVWRILCFKASAAASTSGPLHCDVECQVDDHFVETK